MTDIILGNRAKAADFIDVSQRQVDPADDAGRVPKLEADGYLSSEFISFKHPMQTLQDIDGSATPVAVMIDGGGTLLIADANDADLDAFIGFVNEDVGQVPAAFLNAVAEYVGDGTFPHTINPGVNRCVIVWHFAQHGTSPAAAPSGVTFDGNAMTKIGELLAVGDDRNIVSAWYYAAGTDVSATVGDIVATGASASDEETMVAHNYIDVDQADPIGASQFVETLNDITPSISITAEQNYSLCAMFLTDYTSGDINSLDAAITQRTNFQDHTTGSVYATGASSNTYTNAIEFSTGDTLMALIELNHANAETAKVATQGVLGGFTGLTAGAKYYLSDTAGEISITPGGTSILLGKAVSTTELLIIQS